MIESLLQCHDIVFNYSFFFSVDLSTFWKAVWAKRKADLGRRRRPKKGRFWAPQAPQKHFLSCQGAHVGRRRRPLSNLSKKRKLQVFILTHDQLIAILVDPKKVQSLRQLP